MESSALEKSMNNSVASRLFFAHTPSMIWWSQNQWSRELISLKTILIVPKNFLHFRSDTTEKKGIINLTSYTSKSYALVVLSNSEDAEFLPFLYRVLFIQSCIIKGVYQQISLSSIFQEQFHQGWQLFSSKFFSVSSSSTLICLNLMPN